MSTSDKDAEILNTCLLPWPYVWQPSNSRLLELD